MKANNLIIAAAIIALSFSACQNNASKNETKHSDHDTSGMAMDSMSMGSGMKSGMDKMMDEMHSMEMTGNVDYDFAMMMKSHHQAAVEMAEVELASGKDEDLKKIAQRIIVAQKSEIDALQTFLNDHDEPMKNYDPARKDEGFAKVMEQNMTMMMDMPAMSESSSTDEKFVQMMTPHHEGAIMMAEGFIKFGKDQGLISMSKKIMQDQKNEIEQFKKWTESR